MFIVRNAQNMNTQCVQNVQYYDVKSGGTIVIVVLGPFTTRGF